VAGLIRFVVSPDGALAPDVAHKLPGRGIWVTARRTALEKAVAKGLFARAARRKVSLPPDLTELTASLLTKHVISLLSLARKSGGAVAGYEKVKESVIAGRAAVLVQASDGSDQQKARIRPPKGDNAHISCLSGNELGLAFGRENVIHAALSSGGLCDRIVEEATKLAGIRSDSAPHAAK